MLTKYEERLMMHTISGENRNWYATGYGNPDAKAFDRLVELGLATSEPAPEWAIDEVVYRLTSAGYAAINQENGGKK